MVEVIERNMVGMTVSLNLWDIKEDLNFQPRAANKMFKFGINPEIVKRYISWLEVSEPPALEVWFGTLNGTKGYWLLAGHHRLRALKHRATKYGSKKEYQEAQCKIVANTYQEAVYKSSLSNLGDNQVYMMGDTEIREACKSFLFVANRLNGESIKEVLDQAQSLTGNKRSWSFLNDSAVSNLFGLSRTTVKNYREELGVEWKHKKKVSITTISSSAKVDKPKDKVKNASYLNANIQFLKKHLSIVSTEELQDLIQRMETELERRK
jgi:hypothetical protein